MGLTWECVDFEKGTVYIKRQLQKLRGKNGAYVLMSLKNDRPRHISPAPAVMNMLRQERVQQAKNRLRMGKAWNNPDNLVFTDETGRYIVPDTAYSHFKRIITALGYPDLRFHDLRHTYAVNALRSGDDIKTVQDNLGHHTAAFTLDTYGHVTEKMKQESAERMERFIQQITGSKKHNKTRHCRYRQRRVLAVLGAYKKL